MAAGWETRSPQAFLEHLAAHPEARGKMFAAQAALPRLPVPDLKQTCERYLQTVRPVIRGTLAGLTPEQIEAQLARTKLAVDEFVKPGGRGEELHRRLLQQEERSKAAGEASWLKQWWYYAAYHSDRVPIPVHSNVYCVSRDHPIAVMQEVDWICRAAAMIHHSMVYSRLIDTADLPADTAGKRALCMDQYLRIFKTCRVPGDPADHLVSYPVEQARHIVVMVRDHFFAVDVLEADLTPRAPEALVPDLEDVLALAETLPAAAGIGILTYENRTPWARAHARLLEHSTTNRATIETIQSAQMVVVFDENRPASRLEIGRLALQGQGHNRFFDKTIQLFIFRNGRLGLNGEHSPGDAPPTAHGFMAFATAMETADEYTKLHRLRRWGAPPSLVAPPTSTPEPHARGFPGAGGVPAVPSSPSAARWRFLAWDVPADVHAAIAAASLTAQRLIQSSQLEFLEYQPYGMEFVRGKAGLSPDSYIQMAMQLAYFRIYGRFTSTYETQQTRAFLHGRTETGRVLSDESMAFVLAMQDPKATPLQRADALRKAIDVHIAYMSDAANGKVFDRYFLGLRLCIQPGEEVPAIFADPAFAASSNFLLSTSNMTPGQYWQGGFGAYLEGGYGCCYGFRPQSIWVSIASRTTCPTTDSVLFKNALHAALDDMGRLVEQIAATQPKAIAGAKRSKL